jgi:hypothetical protein
MRSPNPTGLAPPPLPVKMKLLCALACSSGGVHVTARGGGSTNGLNVHTQLRLEHLSQRMPNTPEVLPARTSGITWANISLKCEPEAPVMSDPTAMHQ